MTTFYLDPVAGNDANAGTSFALRWKTINAGATAARIAPGDTIRVMASPDPTLVDSAASWTQYGKDVTLQSAVTAVIDNCETAWTQSANVTATRQTTYAKQGTYHAQLVIASAFVTGLVAYFATGTLDLSAYQQVCFWIRTNVTLASGRLTLRLCSDAAGVTAVHTIAIPQIFVAARWVPIVWDNAGALSSSIASVALYAEVDPGSVTVYLDNIFAAKAKSANESLTLHSLIGKKWNLPWQASTSYAQNEVVRPTNANRNGLRYQKQNAGSGSTGGSEPSWPLDYGATVTDSGVTWVCLGPEEAWHAIKSINGTTVTIDNDVETLGTAGRGYVGDTESAPLYKREPFVLPGTATTSPLLGLPQEDGTEGAINVYTGGWNTTDMSTQTGETWMTGLGYGYGIANGSGYQFTQFENLHAVRATYGFYQNLQGAIRAKHCSAVASGYGLFTASDCYYLLEGVRITHSDQSVGGQDIGNMEALRCRFDASKSASMSFSVGASGSLRALQSSFRNNYTPPSAASMSGAIFRWCEIDNHAGSVTSVQLMGDCLFENCLVDSNVLDNADFGRGPYRMLFQSYNRTAGDHRAYWDSGVGGYCYVGTATDQRHTASGVAWKFVMDGTTTFDPKWVTLPVARIYCEANTQKTVTIWTRRDQTNVKGRLVVRGGQLAGVPSDVVVACAPSTNTWVQSGNLQFTPTEAGVIEIVFEVTQVAQSSQGNFWVDDLAVS